MANPVLTPTQYRQIVGETGEFMAQQALELKGLTVFVNTDKHVFGSGFDFIAYDPQSRMVWMVDNKALKGTISEASSLTKSFLDNCEGAIKLLLAQRFPEGNAAIQSILNGRVQGVVINDWSFANRGFSPKIFSQGLKAFDVRTGTLYETYETWKADMVAQGILKGGRFVSNGRIVQRGFASIGGVLWAMVLVGGAVYVINQADDPGQVAGAIAANVAIDGLLSSLASAAGLSAGMGPILGFALSLPGDSTEHDRRIYDFIAKLPPEIRDRTPINQLVKEVEHFLFETKPVDIHPRPKFLPRVLPLFQANPPFLQPFMKKSSLEVPVADQKPKSLWSFLTRPLFPRTSQPSNRFQSPQPGQAAAQLAALQTMQQAARQDQERAGQQVVLRTIQTTQQVASQAREVAAQQAVLRTIQQAVRQGAAVPPIAPPSRPMQISPPVARPQNSMPWRPPSTPPAVPAYVPRPVQTPGPAPCPQPLGRQDFWHTGQLPPGGWSCVNFH